MKKIATLATVSVSALAISASMAAAEYTLDILHINDLHSRIESINRFDSTCSDEDEAEGACFGGVARVKTKIDERRDALTGNGANVLVLDAGDQFQGSLFYTTYKGEVAVEFMNGIGFDAMAVGNHEFDDGPEALDTFIAAAEFPVISGNTIAGEGSPLDGDLDGYVIVERGGEQIGIVSVLATDTAETSSPGETIVFRDEIDYLTEAVAELEAEGVNKIILLSHVGLPRDREIAAAVEGIDVIVGGHSHTLLSNVQEDAADVYPVMVANPAGQDVPIVQAYAYSKYLGELRVVFDDDGNVTSAEGEPHLLDASVTPDETFLARVEELGGPIEELMGEVVGESTDPIEGAREVCRAMECSMGNLVADAMLERMRDQGAQIAIQNGGGLRASIDAGPVSMGEVFAVLPFQNTLATFGLSGSDIIAALENGVGQIEEGAGRFPQVAGLKYTADLNAEPGSRVSDVMVVDADGTATPIDEAAMYNVVSNNFMRNGGDGYAMFATNAVDPYDFGPGLEEVVATYLTENTPYMPYTDGRITMVEMMAQAETAEDDMAGEEMAEDESMAEDDMAEEGAMEDDAAMEDGDMAEDEAVAEDDAMAEDDMAEDEAMEDEAMAEDEAMEDDAMADDDMAEDAAMEDDTMAEDDMAEESAMEDDSMAEASPMDGMHTIQAGDTYWDLAVRFYNDGTMWRKIADANPSYRNRALPIGGSLSIPEM